MQDAAILMKIINLVDEGHDPEHESFVTFED
jgi:hypothetical protein